MWYGNLSCINLTDFSSGPVGKKLAKYKNAQEFANNFASLLHIAKHRYRLKEGTKPDTINERVLIDSLLWYGRVVFFEKNGSILALPGQPTNDFNIYGDAGYAHVFGRNGFNEKIKLVIPDAGTDVTTIGLSGNQMGLDGTGVLIRETENMYPFINYINSYADRMCDTMRTIDVQRFQSKRPYMIVAKETAVKSVQEYLKKIGENEEYIVSSGIFDANDVNVVPMSVSAADIKGMTELHDWYMAKFMELCGVSNNQATNKKANLIVDEVNANNEQTEFSVDAIVDYLNRQMETVNNLFGTNMEWEVNQDDETVQDVQRDDDTVSTETV